MFFGNPFSGLNIHGSEFGELIIGSFGNDVIDGKGGNDLIFGLFGNDEMAGGSGDDFMFGGFGSDLMSGGDGIDSMFGGSGNDVLVANKGNDFVFGGKGKDLLVWNNGDGSDLMDGGRGKDTVQVNFDTDLVNNDLQNKDVAEFSVTEEGVQFARIEVNDQTEVGLFQLDIRNTETLETNFGDGDDAAKIVDNVLHEIKLDLDGGDGTDLLDFSKASKGVEVNLAKGTADSAHVANFENVIGTAFDDVIVGDKGANIMSGGDGVDTMYGLKGNDVLVANKGNDFVFGGKGKDLLVWNNGDGSDLMDGGRGKDTVQVNFDTDLVNNDLQNKDVAEFSVTEEGVQFARIEVNDQTEVGLFQLDIRNTETLETNFGDGDDAAKIVDNVLHEIKLDLDGGDGTDLLDFSKASKGVEVNLAKGTADSAHVANFENVIGTAFDDVIVGDDGSNVIASGAGFDLLSGGAGADTFVFNQADTGVKVINDFELGVDGLLFQTDADLTGADIVASLVQDGADVTLEITGKEIVIENASVESFVAEDFLFA